MHRENKLKQISPSKDLFIDEELGIVRTKKNLNHDYDTSLLDISVKIH